MGLKKNEVENVIKDIIKFSELEQFIDNPLKTYSTGMHTRLAFTIATSINPEILILDEIFAGGDFSFIKKAKDRLNKFMNKAKIIIIVSHDLNLVKNICNRMILMDKGKIIGDGSPEKVIEQYINRHTL